MNVDRVQTRTEEPLFLSSLQDGGQTSMMPMFKARIVFDCSIYRPLFTFSVLTVAQIRDVRPGSRT